MSFERCQMHSHLIVGPGKRKRTQKLCGGHEDPSCRIDAGSIVFMKKAIREPVESLRQICASVSPPKKPRLTGRRLGLLIKMCIREDLRFDSSSTCHTAVKTSNHLFQVHGFLQSLSRYSCEDLIRSSAMSGG